MTERRYGGRACRSHIIHRAVDDPRLGYYRWAPGAGPLAEARRDINRSVEVIARTPQAGIHGQAFCPHCDHCTDGIEGSTDG